LISSTTGTKIRPSLSAMYIIGCFLQKDSLTKSASPFLESSLCESSDEFIFASIFSSSSFFQVKSPFLRIDSRFEASVKWKRDRMPCSRRVLALLRRVCFLYWRVQRFSCCLLHLHHWGILCNNQVGTMRPRKVIVCLINGVRATNHDRRQTFAQSSYLKRSKAKPDEGLV